LPSQAYRIERIAEGITVTGGDAAGAMYGGLDVAEAIRSGALDSLKDSVHAPYIAQRGIKFNIPLDLRTPSYTDPSDKGAPRTIEYFRASVRETIRTYPLLAGFGITAGESMPVDIGGMTKENWLWKTYGEGIRDALKDEPQRKFKLAPRRSSTTIRPCSISSWTVSVSGF
jgi:hypothetical protein